MRRLVIDDCRTLTFPHPPVPVKDEMLVHCRTNDSAIEWLSLDYSWDEVWFDYDMGKVYGRLETEYQSTILPTMDYIMERCFYDKSPDIGVCVLHTANPTGRKQLETALSRYFAIRHVDAAAFTVEVIDWAHPRKCTD